MQVNEAIGTWVVVKEGSSPEVNGPRGEVRTHVWGVDLSGTTHGAGGVGGLVATVIHNGLDAGVYFPVYDGNGNVTGYVRAAVGVLVAQYEYAPFGELLRTTGSLAQTFNHLFSTKYFDWETGLSCYGYRYYSPHTGRWPNRDSLGDEAFRRAFAAGKSLRVQRRLYAESLRPSYLFTKNSAVNWIDALGLQAASACFCGPDVSQAVAGHLNDFIQQPQGNLNPILYFSRNVLIDPARQNAQAIRNAAAGIQGCGGGPCTGTFTLCDMCISGRHIDHILIMVYIATSYGVNLARSAGQYQESWWLGFENEGSSFEGADDAVANADLTFNELALCLAQKLKHKARIVGQQIC